MCNYALYHFKFHVVVSQEVCIMQTFCFYVFTFVIDSHLTFKKCCNVIWCQQVVVFVVHVAMQLSIDCPVTYLGMHVMLLSTIACNQIWSMAFLMTCTDLMLHISTRKAIPLAQGNQEEILGVLQQLTNQSWTVLTTTIAFIIAVAINVKYPVINLLSILPIDAHVIRTRRRSLLLR